MPPAEDRTVVSGPDDGAEKTQVLQEQTMLADRTMAIDAGDKTMAVAEDGRTIAIGSQEADKTMAIGGDAGG